MVTKALAEKNKKKMLMKKKRKQFNNKSSSNLFELEENLNEVEEKNESKSLEKKKRKGEKKNEDDSRKVGQISTADKVIKDAEGKKTKNKSSRRKKRKNGGNDEAVAGSGGQLDPIIGGGIDEQNAGPPQLEFQEKSLGDTDVKIEKQNGKSKKAAKSRKTDHLMMENLEIFEKSEVSAMDEVYHIPSGYGDSSKGMKKWVMEYHQSRPGLWILQQRIDDFVTEHEAQEELARKEREARLAEGGWTVVVHNKGRKKTTDSESGVTVGSVAQAIVLDKMAKKKNREVLNFYRFQKREAHRSELMKLRSKFEDDKKRIHQMKAARKFKPY